MQVLAYDQVGSLRVVADGSGNPVKRIDYDSFGNVFSDSAPGFAVPFGFAGGLYDKDTKLVRFGYRDYDPDTGRWTAKDPIRFRGRSTDLYGYCLNDPINRTDSRGLLFYNNGGDTANINGKEVKGTPKPYGDIYTYTDGNDTYAWNGRDASLPYPRSSPCSSSKGGGKSQEEDKVLSDEEMDERLRLEAEWDVEFVQKAIEQGLRSPDTDPFVGEY